MARDRRNVAPRLSAAKGPRRRQAAGAPDVVLHLRTTRAGEHGIRPLAWVAETRSSWRMTTHPEFRLSALYRYPVKGLSPEPLERAELETSGYFPGDRLYAVENGPSGFDAVAPRHQPKTKYLMLMRDEALARLRTHYDDATATLTVEGDGETLAARLDTPEGRAKNRRVEMMISGKNVEDAMSDSIASYYAETQQEQPNMEAAGLPGTQGTAEPDTPPVDQTALDILGYDSVGGAENE